MKLNDAYAKPLKEVVEQMDLASMKVFTDDDGNIEAIELKYEPTIEDIDLKYNHQERYLKGGLV